MTVEQIRLSHHLTQPEMAEFIGISMRSYTNKIKGVTSWLPHELARIAELYSKIEIPCGEKTLLFQITSNFA